MGDTIKGVIVYQTTFGSNRKVADYVEDYLRREGHDVEVFEVKRAGPGCLEGADICFFSSPTHIGNSPRRMRNFLKQVVDSAFEGDYALIATAVPTKNPDETNALHGMESILKDGGMRKVGELVLHVDMGLQPGYEGRLDGFLSSVLSDAGLSDV